MADRILIRDGIVLTQDEQLGEQAGSDVLIEGDTIKAVGRNLSADGAKVIEASGDIVMKCDADDLYPQGRLAFQVKFLQERPDVAAVKGSRIHLAEVPDGAALRGLLEVAFGVLVRVVKRREIWRWDGVQVHLDTVEGLGTFVEFELLALLASNPGVVYSRRQLLERLRGGADYREPRTIDVHVRHLREKIEREPREPELILTVRGAGYRFRDG